MAKILHITQQLSRGGAGKSMLALAKYSKQYGNHQHQVISLLSAEVSMLQRAKLDNVHVIESPAREDILTNIESSDIVHIHFWNSPQLYDLLRSELPAMRLLMWFHIAGDKAPQVITSSLIAQADFALACSPYTYQRNVFQNLPNDIRVNKIGLALAGSDFQELDAYQKREHSNFNVGYIGTVDFVKMHQNYIAMSTAVKIADVRFVVCGGGVSNYLAQQAQDLGALDKFEFKGYVDNIRPILEVLDIYGYPLCEDTYAAAELNLQEVMYCGIPPVVFPYGGVKDLIANNETGLVVNNEREYTDAIEYLYHHPKERERLGSNAHNYASDKFGAANAAQQINIIYDKLMRNPKQERVWGIPVGVSVLEQNLEVEDLLRTYYQPSASELFVESLGDVRPEFTRSLIAQDTHVLFADQQIAQASPLLRSAGAGGILHYRNYYPNDPYLRLWSGLVHQHQGQHQIAINEFSDATKLGFTHWRILWYIAQSAVQIQNYPLAQQALSGVLQHAPDFTPAQDLAQFLAAPPEPDSLNQSDPAHTNIIALPDWTQDEDTTYTDFYPLLQWFLQNQHETLHLWIDIEGTDPEAANLLLIAVLSELSMAENLDLEYETNFHLIDTLGQWTLEQLTSSNIHRFPLPHENPQRARLFPSLSIT